MYLDTLYTCVWEDIDPNIYSGYLGVIKAGKRIAGNFFCLFRFHLLTYFILKQTSIGWTIKKKLNKIFKRSVFIDQVFISCARKIHP